jgi:Domain of unknown function (DUF362)
MHRKRLISRRQFLIGSAAALGGSALIWARRPGLMPAVQGQDPGPTPMAFLPYVVRNHSPLTPPLLGKVIHVHGNGAVDWTGEGDYWNYMDQDTVNNMVDRGLMELTGAVTVADAWRALIPAYEPGQKIAIKVNFNNSGVCNNTAPVIDALIEPVNAVVSGLEQIGVARADVWVYDAIRALPDHFVAKGLPGVRFFDGYYTGACREQAGFRYEPETRVTFYPPPGVTIGEVHVTNVLMDATYLINMPIMKGTHPLAGVTLGFKNHFGTLNNPAALHDYVNVVYQPPAYRTDYNPLVDLHRSPLIGGKTVLTIGDGLFAAREYNQAPVPWTTFGDQVPKSLFFARDPVAVDCVMHDLLAAEPGTNVPDGTNNYLRLAGEAALGAFERGDPWQEPYGSGYSSIQYIRVEV